MRVSRQRRCRASRRQARGGLFYREFPPEILRRLEHLAFVKDPDDLGAKYAQAIAWFREAIEAINERQVRRLIHGTTTRQVVTPGSRVAQDVLPDRRLREGV